MSGRYRDEPKEVEGKVYVGGLPSDATPAELEDAFTRFGRLKKVWVAKRPPGFGFVEFEDHRDAEDACRDMDGKRICGVRARVELSHGKRRNRYPQNGDGGGGGGGGGGRGRDPPPRRRRSRSRSPPYRRTRSRSRSPPPRRSRSRSPPPRRSESRSPVRRSRSRS